MKITAETETVTIVKSVNVSMSEHDAKILYAICGALNENGELVPGSVRSVMERNHFGQNSYANNKLLFVFARAMYNSLDASGFVVSNK